MNIKREKGGDRQNALSILKVTFKRREQKKLKFTKGFCIAPSPPHTPKNDHYLANNVDVSFGVFLFSHRGEKILLYSRGNYISVRIVHIRCGVRAAP